MSDFAEMYKRFNLDEHQLDHLNKLANRRYPFQESSSCVSIETVILDGSKETRKEEGVVNAELV